MLGVLQRNPEFRRLWIAQAISQIGDWLNRVAILTLIGNLGGGSPEGLATLGLFFGLEIAVRFLPGTLIGVFVGPLADRLCRKRLMIAMDVGRGLSILLLLTVDSPEKLPLLYGVLFLQMMQSFVFEAARGASVPNTLRPEDLLVGNALSAITWSVMLSVGGLLGAFATKALGIGNVFLVDALTYAVSALILLRLKLPPQSRPTERWHFRAQLRFEDLRRAAAHARTVHATHAIFAKSAWGGAGGFLVVLALAARESAQFAVDKEDAAAVAIGIAYAIRGVGTAIGPFMGRRFIGSGDRALERQIGGGFLIGALGYAAFGCVGFGWGLLFVAFAHIGGSVLWVGSTTLWQRRIHDAYRGRASTLESAGMMISSSVGAVLTGLIYDLVRARAPEFALPAAAFLSALLVLLGGGLWWSKAQKSAAESAPTGQT